MLLNNYERRRRLQEKLFKRLVKKNYNDELEKVLENKKIDETAKNLLLGILYKVEASYKDFYTVKRNIETKDEYIKKIINIIEEDCDKIIVVNQEQVNNLQNKTFIVNKENKEIIIYPIERKLLYAISKIGKNDIILEDKYNFLNRHISDIINVGNNIETVEPLRDFNGWSWSVVNREIEGIEYNILYQNIRILIGNRLLKRCIQNKNSNKDYLKLLKLELEKKMRK